MVGRKHRVESLEYPAQLKKYMIEKPEISVIVPVYNAEKWLPKCLDSILGQTYTDFELILVNDGSTDNSLEICNAYASKDNRIRVFSKENGGVSSARNIGLDNARGEWILFIDADDTLPHNALETLHSQISDDIDIIFAGYNTVKDNQIIPGPEPREQEMTNTELAIELFSPTDRRYLGYVWSKIYRRALIKNNDIRFDKSIRYNEDRLFILEFLSYSQKGKFSTNPIYNYVIRTDSAMGSINGPKFYLFETDLDAFIRMTEIAPYFNDEKVMDLVRKGTFESYMWNKCLNKEFGNNDRKTNQRLKQKLLSVVPFRSVIFLTLKNHVDKILTATHKIKRHLLHKKNNADS